MASRPSAWSSSRARPAVALALALAALAAGCGSGSSPRTRVAAYIQRVNRVELKLAVPLAIVTRTATAFVGQPPFGPSRRTAGQARALHRAAARVSVAVRELAGLPAPAPAAHLRRLLISLAGSQLRLARELARLVAVAPRFYAALRGLGPATVRLEDVLVQSQGYGSAAVAAVYAAKEAALRRFSATTRSILGELRPLRPPAVLRPSYDAAVGSLRGMGRSAGQLATALQAGASATAAVAGFDRAAAAEGSAVTVRAQAAAARAYENERARLTTLTDSIAREETRLERTLR